ncbi:MAG: bifunctional proline dehydrogenase/L-glutamate gamma-semialdehyde dehydrogenase PutA [Methylococcales symbiont of Hymedesmia sp. n. MRB-2018]|nr:MAG: bifunctional proline dehydrogenase/L-glutamate gamma-semialdehyde dehydrogenase PutA [Methylococcales symbiont of Hymedesmia sp. n. MRB-2018]
MNQKLKKYRDKINQDTLADESVLLDRLLLNLTDYDAKKTQHRAKSMVKTLRENNKHQNLAAAFMQEYQLSCDEGLVLMSIAEALLRIPDQHTQDLFLQEKLTEADWHKHLHHSDSLMVNFVSQTLDITAKFERSLDLSEIQQQQVFSSLSARLGLPIIRTAVKQAMQQMAYQFVMAESIDKALDKAKVNKDTLYSFDMLGEAALTLEDGQRYFNAYTEAIEYLAQQAQQHDIYKNPNISIKLSALYPRYEALQQQLAIAQVSPKLLALCQQAFAAHITVTIDAEESERLALSLDIFYQVISHQSLQQWSGLGLTVQTYQKRAMATLHYLKRVSQQLHCKIPIRLVKGAYWDSEIKRAQVNGLINYPVFTDKAATDVCYLACTQYLLNHSNHFYPQFATHNAHTVAAIETMAGKHSMYEFQRLHGMGEQLYQTLSASADRTMPCRIYAPVGIYQDLLPYLVRRLLENGANTSFINQLENPTIDITSIIADPVVQLKKLQKATAFCTLPKDLFGNKRINSAGVNLADITIQQQIEQSLDQLQKQKHQAHPLLNGEVVIGVQHPIINPSNPNDEVGTVIFSDQASIDNAIESASFAFKTWRLSAAVERANILQKAANLIEQNRLELLSLCVREAGKTIADSLAEIREAVDFCRYYAQQAIDLFAQPIDLPGFTGEKNQLKQYGRGIFVCISPWNFPLAIFIGQISAALASGNTVIAKPASQTPLIAMRCIQILHEAGIPKNVLHFLPSDGAIIARYLLSDHRIAGVAFTGSNITAQSINQQLSNRLDIIPLIAETGGQNVMIVDNSAYPEQLIKDVIHSSFNSAGQRCSALRVLFLPNQIADSIIERIIQVMQLLIIANPKKIATDIGPVISSQACKQLHEHVIAIKPDARKVFQLSLKDKKSRGNFFPPTVIELDDLSQLTEEHFGPILHVIRYDSDHIERVIEAVNHSGYGLTLGIHSRINHTIKQIVEQCKVGNIYINRNMISAVVGVQPFGGMGLSGTGPKAGGPYYLNRFSIEQTITTNNTAIGGDINLLTKS